MPFSFSIPTSDPAKPLELSVDAGDLLFILGANGTGKSSLLQLFNTDSGGLARRISSSPNLAPERSGWRNRRAKIAGWGVRYQP